MTEVTAENKEQPLSTTIARHYDNGENNFSARNESRILYLRNFNNWIKSTLIQEAVLMLRDTKIHDGKMHVLDLACGKGGDLNKWRNSSCMEYLVAVDISAGSIANGQSRYDDMKRRNRYLFDAKFIVADCTRVNISKFFINPNMQLHLVSCQFAFHYCFESLQQAECMLKNVSENLISGGIFIGTIPNAWEIVRRQKECGKKQFGNSVYNIDFMCDIDKPFPIFGAKYNFHLEGVVDCPEFLVYFPVLEKIAKNFGLELKMKMTFAEYFKKHLNVNTHFLNRITALESAHYTYKNIPSKITTAESKGIQYVISTQAESNNLNEKLAKFCIFKFLYPPQEGNTIMGTEDDYESAKQFLNENKLNSVGTLSKTEWDVATLYMVFMFQKI